MRHTTCHASGPPYCRLANTLSLQRTTRKNPCSAMDDNAFDSLTAAKMLRRLPEVLHSSAA